jgi:hypothetical protein
MNTLFAAAMPSRISFTFAMFTSLIARPIPAGVEARQN